MARATKPRPRNRARAVMIREKRVPSTEPMTDGLSASSAPTPCRPAAVRPKPSRVATAEADQRAPQQSLRPAVTAPGRPHPGQEEPAADQDGQAGVVEEPDNGLRGGHGHSEAGPFRGRRFGLGGIEHDGRPGNARPERLHRPLRARCHRRAVPRGRGGRVRFPDLEGHFAGHEMSVVAEEEPDHPVGPVGQVRAVGSTRLAGPQRPGVGRAAVAASGAASVQGDPGAGEVDRAREVEPHLGRRGADLRTGDPP